MTSAAEITAIRQKLGYTRADLAEALGLGRHRYETVYRWELGKNAPSPAVMLAIRGLVKK